MDKRPATALQALDRANQRAKHVPETGSWVPPSLCLDVSAYFSAWICAIVTGSGEPHGRGSKKIDRHINRMVVVYFLPF